MILTTPVHFFCPQYIYIYICVLVALQSLQVLQLIKQFTFSISCMSSAVVYTSYTFIYIFIMKTIVLFKI